jgi:alpha-L-fucosidase
VTEFVTRGLQTIKGNNLYLIVRYWDNRTTLRLAGLKTKVKCATLLTTGQVLGVKQDEKELVLSGLPAERPTALCPVIRLEFASKPEPNVWGRCRTWCGDTELMAKWAETRGTSVWTDGKPR